MKHIKKFTALLMSMCVLTSSLVTTFAGISDLESHWAEKEIVKWNQYGIINGDNNGSFRPNDSISRAEFIALISRVFGLVEKSDTNFKDISADSWYANDISKAYKAGAITGDENGLIHPDDSITRQEAAMVLTRLFFLKSKDSRLLDSYSDAKDISDWAKLAMNALVDDGYIKGRENNKLAPQDSITRAEAIKIIDNIAKNFIKTSGTYEASMKGNVIVNTSGVLLKNLVIDGDLYLTQGIANENILLENVIVKGRTFIFGGGEQGVVLKNSTLEGVLLVDKQDGRVKIVANGSTQVKEAELNSGALLVEENLTGEGFNNVIIAEKVPSTHGVKFNGSFDNVRVEATNSRLEVTSGTVNRLNIVSGAMNTECNISSIASVKELIVDAPSNITGKGKIEIANVNSNGVNIEIAPIKVNTKPGIEEPSLPRPPVNPPVVIGGGGSTGGSTGGNTGGGPNTPVEELLKYESIMAKGNTITINFSENLDASSIPAPSDFKIVLQESYKLDQTHIANITNVKIDGKKIILSLVDSVDNRIPKISYTKGQNPLRAAGDKYKVCKIDNANAKIYGDFRIDAYRIDGITPIENATINIYSSNQLLYSAKTDKDGIFKVVDHEIGYEIKGNQAVFSNTYLSVSIEKELFEPRFIGFYMLFNENDKPKILYIPSLEEVNNAYLNVKSASVHDTREALEYNSKALNLELFLEDCYRRLNNKDTVALEVYKQLGQINNVFQLREAFKTTTKNEDQKEEISLKQLSYNNDTQVLKLELNKRDIITDEDVVKNAIAISENGESFHSLDPQDIVRATNGAITINFSNKIQSKNMFVKIQGGALKDIYGSILYNTIQTSYMSLEKGVINAENSGIIRAKKNTTKENTISLKIQLRDATLQPITGVAASEFGGSRGKFDSSSFSNFKEEGNGIYTVDYNLNKSEIYNYPYKFIFDLYVRDVQVEKGVEVFYRPAPKEFKCSSQAVIDPNDRIIATVALSVYDELGSLIPVFDIPNANLLMRVTSSKGEASIENGKIKLQSLVTNIFQVDEKVSISILIVDAINGNVVFCNQVSTITNKYDSSKDNWDNLTPEIKDNISIKGTWIYNKDNKILRTDSNPEDFLLVVEAFDENGNEVDLSNNKFMIQSTNSDSLRLNSNFERVSIDGISRNISRLQLPGDGVLNAGITRVYIISLSTGKLYPLDITIEKVPQ